VATYTDEAIADETVLALAARIRYEVKDFDTAGRAFPGGVRIRTIDGRSIERELRFQRGDPENPMSTEEVLDKFTANASLALGDGDRQELADAVMGIERESDLSALRLLARASRRVAA
jgi:2-methylcitrate dehydratase PrpD